MTARQGKTMAVVAIAVLSAAIALDVAVTLLKHKPLSDLTSLIPGVLLIVVFLNFWGSYAKLEAEHGPEYVATRTSSRTLILLGVLLLALGVGLGFFIAARR
jgi:hypothetical protein